MRAFKTYVSNNRTFIPNYGERYRQGKPISTAFVESAVNQVVSRRFVKKQQMRWPCRTGVCHTCEGRLISGSVKYDPEPLEPPAAGNLLICCLRPREDVVIEL